MLRLLVLVLATFLLVPSAAFADQGAPLVDVALDPGHSRADVGATGGGLAEYVVTLDLANRVRTILESAGRTVRMTREDNQPLTSMSHPDSTERIRIEQFARIEAAAPARVFVSLHFNGGPASLRGTETYYNPDRSPDLPAADWTLAEAIHRNVVAALTDYGYSTLDRGVRSDLLAGKPYGHFFSLRGPMPSVLVESLFLSNPYEAQLLRDDSTRDALAWGVSQGVLEYLAGVPD